MTLQIIGSGVLWFFLFCYVIVASVDFGAGFFSFYSELSGKRHLIHNIIERYLSPVWEVTNVFLIFFFVGTIGFFPESAYYFGTALLIPGSIAIILLAIRGSYYAFSSYVAKDNKWYSFLYGLTGLFIPAALSTVLTISEGGYIKMENGNVILQYDKLFFSTYSWAVVLLAIASVLYISSTFLTFYASKAEDHQALNILRKYSLSMGIPTIAASLLVFFAIRQQNLEHFQNMLSLWWVFALSLLSFAAAMHYVYWRKHYGLAFVFVMLQYALAFFGYGAAHLPYVLYPYLTLKEHFTNHTMAVALIIAFIAGLFLLIPSLYLLVRLFLFNAKYVKGSHSKG